jgi:superfamily II DNA or RNA helicase
MTSTYLGIKGYSIYKECLPIEEQETIRKELTVKAFAPKSCIAQPVPFPVYRESAKKFYLPRFYGFDTYGDPDEIKISEGKPIDLKFKGELRPAQKPIVEKFIKHAKRKGCGLLEIFCGAGKTVLSLKIISQLKKKTLVIVHKDFLLRQWVERIEQFLPDARVGRIQADIIDVENKDIVIGMLQSISMKEYPLSLFQEFGLAIFDECFPYYTKIHTEMGIINIGSLYEKWKNKEVLPNILSFNRETKKFEYKKMTYAWRKEKEDLIKIKMSKRTINCTPEHKILTINGYIEANKLKLGDLIISKYDKNISKKNYEIIPVLNEDYGTLKITNISYFKNKGANRCIKPYVYDIEVEDNHNFIIGSGAPKNQEQYIDGPVVSNCHHISAEVFSRSLFKIVTKYALGLSATMKRKDGLTPVFKMFLGDVVVKKERPLQDNVRVNAISYINTDAKYSKTELNYRGQTNYTIMIKKLCEFNRRSEFILKVLIKTLKNYKGDQIMIIGHNKSLLKYLHDAIVDRKISDVGYYVGGMKPKDLKESENKPVIIATYAMAEEALDIKTLAILLMATPKVDVRQAVGRILRSVDGQKLVVDIIDQHPIFQRHWKKRRTWYNKQTFKIMHTDIEGFKKDNWQLLKKRGKIKVNIPSSDPLSIFSQGKCQF